MLSVFRVVQQCFEIKQIKWQTNSCVRTKKINTQLRSMKQHEGRKKKIWQIEVRDFLLEPFKVVVDWLTHCPPCRIFFLCFFFLEFPIYFINIKTPKKKKKMNQDSCLFIFINKRIKKLINFILNLGERGKAMKKGARIATN